jgi:dihydropteroate synthase
MLLNGSVIDLSKPLVMGILNVTPDSFHDGGRYVSNETIAERALQICNEGAAIIDIGAYSSRPGAIDISVDEELERLLPAIEIIKKNLPNFPISVDTFRSKVVKSVVQNFGSVIVNDISAGELDTEMPNVVGDLQLPYICMHMRGTPQTMQQNTEYQDLVSDILQYFAVKIKAFRKAGINDIICDPGFGFSKTVDQNFELLAKLDTLQLLEVPVLAGLSRKSMIWKTLEIQPSQALNGTTALNMVALQKGASILRVHDVKEAVETVSLYSKLLI